MHAFTESLSFLSYTCLFVYVLVLNYSIIKILLAFSILHGLVNVNVHLNFPGIAYVVDNNLTRYVLCCHHGIKMLASDFNLLRRIYRWRFPFSELMIYNWLFVLHCLVTLWFNYFLLYLFLKSIICLFLSIFKMIL